MQNSRKRSGLLMRESLTRRLTRHKRDLAKLRLHVSSYDLVFNNAPNKSSSRSLLMSRDYFAEMYVAGILADNGWNIYFPRRDKGFDFIITKPIGDEIIVRPVQVKGKYPEVEISTKPETK